VTVAVLVVLSTRPSRIWITRWCAPHLGLCVTMTMVRRGRELVEEIHDLNARFAVEVAGGLI
jgi:hypothetical protein